MTYHSIIYDPDDNALYFMLGYMGSKYKILE